MLIKIASRKKEKHEKANFFAKLPTTAIAKFLLGGSSLKCGGFSELSQPGLSCAVMISTSISPWHFSGEHQQPRFLPRRFSISSSVISPSQIFFSIYSLYFSMATSREPSLSTRNGFAQIEFSGGKRFLSINTIPFLPIYTLCGSFIQSCKSLYFGRMFFVLTHTTFIFYASYATLACVSLIMCKK